MRRWTVGLLIAGVASGAQAGDKVLYQPAPAWITPAPAIDAAKLGDDAPLFLTLDQQDRLADGAVWAYRDVATRMATPEVVQQAGTINLEWQPAKGDLVIHRVEILRGGQHLDALAGGKSFTVIRREQQLEQQAIDGQLTATLAVEGLQVGDVLRASFSVSRREDALGGAVQDVASVPVAPARVGFARTRLLWPAATPVHWKLGSDTSAAHETVVGGEHEVIVAGMLPAMPDLPNDVPLRFRKLPLLESTTLADWPAVSRVMAPLYAPAGLIKPGGALAGEVAAIAAKSPDPVARADAALELVQAKVRYLFNGLDKGNYVPQSPEQTWALRYGDCKAKTLLLLAMLHDLGVTAEPVLANLQLGDAVPERLPSAAAFDHVLVHATMAGRDYWLDGTGAGARFADLGDVPPLHWVLPVRTAGAALLAVPTVAPERPQADVTVELDQRAGIRLPTVAHLKVTLRGAAAQMLGLARTQGTKEQKDAAVQAMMSELVGGDAVVSGYTLGYDPVEAVATVDASGTAKTLWQRLNGSYRLSLDHSTTKIDFDPDRSRPAWAAMPVATGGPLSVVTTTRVLLPGKGERFALDGDAVLPSPLAATTIRRTVAQADGQITVTDRLTASGGEVTVADVPAMRARVALAKSRALALVAPADAPPGWQAVRDARTSGVLKPVLSAYADAIALRPDDANAIQNRATFLAEIADWQGAIIDLDKAIAIAPTAQRYRNRADAEWNTRADDKALADYRAAAQLDPGSVDNAGVLAEALATLGRGGEALTLVQQGIDAGGKNRPTLLARKASVLARAGDRAAALAASAESVAARPGDPDLLNERCWLKAQLNVELDTALKDCTKSIELSDTSAAALDSRALVYFRLNRFDDGLADLTAALEQSDSQADSLYLRGIILGRQGKKADAGRDLAAAAFILPRVADSYAPFGIKP